MSQKPLPSVADTPITHITVGGFKSIGQEQSIEIKPLTILAGANSSGKSSIMQPLLLLKQTLEATYDPGPLLLNGPNVKFTSTEQLLARTHNKKPANSFHVGITVSEGVAITTSFKQSPNKGFDLDETHYDVGGERFRLFRGMPQDEILSVFARTNFRSFQGEVAGVTPMVTQDRCFLKLYAGLNGAYDFLWPVFDERGLKPTIRRIINFTILWGDSERNYLEK